MECPQEQKKRSFCDASLDFHLATFSSLGVLQDLTRVKEQGKRVPLPTHFHPGPKYSMNSTFATTPTAHLSPSLPSKPILEAKTIPLHPISASGLESTTGEAPTVIPDSPCPTIEPSSTGSAFFRIEIGPGLHQIKDYNMHPTSVLRLNYKPNPSDVLLVYLQCDPGMRRKDPLLFLEAVSPKYGSEEGQLWFPALKVCKAMLKGRTKDFSFHLCFQLIQHNQPTVKILSAPFYIWSNVSQTGYPRDKRAEYKEKSEELGQHRKRH
jgi:hypothetical protein